MWQSRLVLIVSIVVALALLAAGGAKIARLDFEIEAFTKWGLPLWLMVQVGIVEVIAAILLVLPRTATLGAVLGAAVMTVAVPTHIFSGEMPAAPIPLVLLGLLVLVGWARRQELAIEIGHA
jgi:uncharacterized membrane protein YphA (DoxX/SURF4 family)